MVCGESMLDLYEALSEAGLDVRGYEGTLSGLRILEAPGILHWEEDEDGKGRFVVYYGFRSGKYVIGDPKRGVRRVGPPDLARHWKSLHVAVCRRHRTACFRAGWRRAVSLF